MTALARALPKSAGWLGEALADLDEVAAGFEVDGPTPDETVVSTSGEFLRDLARRVATEPGVDHDGLGGVGVEFVGRDRDRVLFIIENDRTAWYHEYIGGEGASARYDDWREMMGGIGDSWIVRAGLQRVPGGPERT